jgi:hypothetical protein
MNSICLWHTPCAQSNLHTTSLNTYPSAGLEHALCRSSFSIYELFQVSQEKSCSPSQCTLSNLFSPRLLNKSRNFSSPQYSIMYWFCERSHLLNALLEELHIIFSNYILRFLLCRLFPQGIQQTWISPLNLWIILVFPPGTFSFDSI